LASTVVLRKGSDESVVIPDERVASGWSAKAELTQYPGGPVLQEWTSSAGTAVVEPGQVVLLCNKTSSWSGWTSGEVDVHLRGPSGTRLVIGPIRVRLR
jgi:hypothetical protein